MGLRASEHKWTLLALYLTTLLMRASFYITIAVIQSSSYLGGAMTEWDVAAVLVVYPVVELSSVSFFGSYSDKVGRKSIFIASLFFTGTAALLFALTPLKTLTIVFSAVFGLGAAAQVSSTLSIVADCSSEHNRARLMGYYDLSTLMGLAGGYGIGILLLQFGYASALLLLGASGGCLISALVAAYGIKETRASAVRDVSIRQLLGRVVRDRRIQRMVFVYVPIISLYGLVIANAENILEEHFTLDATELLVLFGMLGGALVLGIITMGHLSDRLNMRRPFIVTGLLGFGSLAFVLVANAQDFGALWAVWPVLPALGFTAGAFPPAAMAYLTDISHADARGSTMGVYSIFFGTGMIIGPMAGAFAYTGYGLVGLGVLVSVLIVVAVVGTYFLPEALKPAQQSPGQE
ncbi:MAG: MFS transporter [Candidatus Thorarchaeota archaeon]|nr:MFS transporter [Candidatus Thorarchaeota archaeon]